MQIAETKRLLIREFLMSDVDAMLEVYGDPQVMRFSSGLRTREWVQQRLQRAIEQDYPQNGFGNWAVVEKESHHVIGFCGLERCPHYGEEFDLEIGYRFAREHWGRGYATEAALAVCEYGFKQLKCTRIIALIDPHNQASINVANKLGMKPVDEIMLEGYSHPDLVYVVGSPL